MITRRDFLKLFGLSPLTVLPSVHTQSSIMPEYEELPVHCDCTIVSLQEAVSRVGPAFIYNLYVCNHPEEILCYNKFIKEIYAEAKDNPFAPHLNLVPVKTKNYYEWCIEANGKAVGSEGA